jgi:redox-regulated HSP33 family molecular chaperone
MMTATSAASASSRKAAKWSGRLRSAGFFPDVVVELSLTTRVRAMIAGDRAATARR